MNVGLLIPKVLVGDEAAPSPEGDYVAEFVSKYDLTPAQERSLRLVLKNGRDEEIAVLTSAEATQLPPPIQNRLLAIRSRTQQRLRALLDDRQRASYDLESRPTNRR